MFENKPEKEEGSKASCVITCSPCEISLSAQRTTVTQSIDTALLAIHTQAGKSKANMPIEVPIALQTSSPQLTAFSKQLLLPKGET